MKYPASLEFKEKIVFIPPWTDTPPIEINKRRPSIYDFPRLVTQINSKGVPDSSGGKICRTVNGAVRLEILDYALEPFELWANASLMGSYGGKTAVIQEHSFGPDFLGIESTGIINAKSPQGDKSYGNLYSTANMSAGAYGFDLFSSYTNLADSIFIRVEINSSFGDYLNANRNKLTFQVSGFLLAADPA